MAARASAAALRTLVAGLVDYAGLFPPAALSMADAVSAYDAHLASPDAWMLGRFVCGAERLPELATEHARLGSRTASPWRIAMLAGDDIDQAALTLRAFNESEASRLHIDVVEAKTPTAETVARAARAVALQATLYVELPLADDPRPLLLAARDAGVRAKARTGGLTTAAFPTAAQLARFIVRAAELRVPWKATAGLHHPLRAEHRLTYAADAPRGTMFGFLNVFAAAAFAHAGVDERTIVELLEERAADALSFDDAGLHWRGRSLSTAELDETRRGFATSFGSCSFQEPVDDLHQLGLL